MNNLDKVNLKDADLSNVNFSGSDFLLEVKLEGTIFFKNEHFFSEKAFLDQLKQLEEKTCYRKSTTILHDEEYLQRAPSKELHEAILLSFLTTIKQAAITIVEKISYINLAYNHPLFQDHFGFTDKVTNGFTHTFFEEKKETNSQLLLKTLLGELKNSIEHDLTSKIPPRT